jgi:hypothetical protein
MVTFTLAEELDLAEVLELHSAESGPCVPAPLTLADAFLIASASSPSARPSAMP